MNIGIIGAGSVAQTLAGFWIEAGHQVMLSSRNPDKIMRDANTQRAKVGTATDAAQFGDVILLALSYNTLNTAIESIQAQVHDKLVIDATNPLIWNEDGTDTIRVIGDDEIAGVVLQGKLPGARVAKAFTTLWMGHIKNHANATPRIAMTLAADAEEDRALISTLIEQVGLEPVSLGGLAQSRPLDPPSPIWNVVLTPEQLLTEVADYRATL